ncbi:MAG TPA: zf-HC2 domain-containing protein [Tepidisphaeraceae bacterium]
METCPYSPQISAYHDGELTGEARRQLEEHLGSACPACATELEQWRRLSALVVAAPIPHLPESARQHLYQLAPTVREAGFIRLAEWTTALAASVLIAVSAWMMVNRPQRTAPVVADADVPTWRVAMVTASETPSEAQAEPQFADYVATSFASGGGSGSHD